MSEKAVARTTAREEGVAAAPRPRLPRKRVLSEDEYIDRLEEIIQRDFFPESAKLDLQLAYLRAEEERDTEGMHLARRLLTDTPGAARSDATPRRLAAGQAAQGRAPRSAEEARSAGGEQISLNQYLAKYTSEDNASFEEIQDKNIKEHERKFWWAFDANAAESAMARGLPDRERKLLGVRDTSHERTNDPMNPLLFYPKGTMDQQTETKPQGTTVAKNTRFQPSSSGASRVRSDSLRDAAHAGAFDGAGAPLVRGYGFVTTPTPQPRAGGQTPVMTWGEIGTPSPLDIEPDMSVLRSNAQFRIPEPPKRDILAARLADRTRERRKHEEEERKRSTARRLAAARTPSMLSPMLQRREGLSDAAKRLIQAGRKRARTPRITPTRGGDVTDNLLDPSGF